MGQTQAIEDELWTFDDIAGFLKMSKKTIYKNWKKMGIRPVIAYPGAKPRFEKKNVIEAVGAMK